MERYLRGQRAGAASPSRGKAGARARPSTEEGVIMTNDDNANIIRQTESTYYDVDSLRDWTLPMSVNQLTVFFFFLTSWLIDHSTVALCREKVKKKKAAGNFRTITSRTKPMFWLHTEWPYAQKNVPAQLETGGASDEPPLRT